MSWFNFGKSKKELEEMDVEFERLYGSVAFVDDDVNESIGVIDENNDDKIVSESEEQIIEEKSIEEDETILDEANEEDIIDESLNESES